MFTSFVCSPIWSKSWRISPTTRWKALGAIAGVLSRSTHTTRRPTARPPPVTHPIRELCISAYYNLSIFINIIGRPLRVFITLPFHWYTSICYFVHSCISSVADTRTHTFEARCYMYHFVREILLQIYFFYFIVKPVPFLTLHGITLNDWKGFFQSFYKTTRRSRIWFLGLLIYEYYS